MQCWAFQVTAKHVQRAEQPPTWFLGVARSAAIAGTLLVTSNNEDVWRQAFVGDWVICVADRLLVVSDLSFRANLAAGEPERIDLGNPAI